MPTVKQNLKPLQDSLGDALLGQLRGILGDAVEDLDGPARQSMALMAVAARRNKPELVAECRDQIMGLLVENELRALEGKEAMLDLVLGKGLDALFAVAVGGLASLTVVP